MDSHEEAKRQVTLAHATEHADPLVREVMKGLLAEHAALHLEIAENEERVLTLRGRRAVGRLVMVLMVVVNLALLGAWVGYSTNKDAADLRQGWHDGLAAQGWEAKR